MKNFLQIGMGAALGALVLAAPMAISCTPSGRAKLAPPMSTPFSIQRSSWMMMERTTTPITAPESEFMPPTTSIDRVMKVRPR